MANTNLFEIADDIIKQVNIVEVISRYYPLTKKGRNYTCLCPFHADKHLGNFYVSEEKQFFKCFSCGKSGNALTFIQLRENLSYIDSLKRLCQIAGIRDPRLEEKESKSIYSLEEQQTLKCLTAIDEFYQVSFQNDEGKKALEYLHNRGLSDEIIKTFKIGYAQSNGSNIINYLTSKGFSLKTIESTGICRLDNGPARDVNAGRITFSVSNRDGQTVGFSARIFGNMVSDSKYVNTRETKFFNKSKLLYNFHNAVNEAKRFGYIYVLEGFMDVIAAYRAGVKSAVGLMGTAFTKEQLQLLRYLKVEVRICLDLDEPGQQNAEKVAKMLEEGGIKYRFVNNNQPDINEKDADEILAKHGEVFLQDYLNNLIDKAEWLLNYYSKYLNLSTLEGRKELVKKFTPIIANTVDNLDYEDYLTKLINLTSFPRKTLVNIIDKYKSKQLNDLKNEDDFDFAETKDVISRLERAEMQLLRLIIDNKDIYSLYSSKLGYFTNENYRKIIKVIESFIEANNEQNNYNFQTIFNYILFPENEIDEKEKNELSKEITDIYNFKEQIPIKDDAQMNTIANELISTIRQEKEEIRHKESSKKAIHNMSKDEQLALLKANAERKNSKLTTKKEG